MNVSQVRKLEAIIGERLEVHDDEVRYGRCDSCETKTDNPPMSVNYGKGVYYCHSCEKGGKIKDIISEGTVPHSESRGFLE